MESKNIRTRKRKKRRNKMDDYLRLIAITLALFTVAMMVIYCTTGGIPDTLCTCVFGALTGECGFMAIIKSFKEKYKSNDDAGSGEDDSSGAG